MLKKNIYNQVKDLFNTYSWDNLLKGVAGYVR